MPIRRPVLVVEGGGDAEAVPLLFRRVAERLNYYDLVPAPNPMRVGDASVLSRPEQLEKHIYYATTRNDADSVLVALDFDVFRNACTVTTAKGWSQRIGSIPNISRPVALCFFQLEYEALFLASISDISAAHPARNWTARAQQDFANAETIRAAKEEVCKMINGGSYKPSVDQARFTAASNLEKLDATRCFRRFQSAIEWLYNWDAQKPICSPVHP